MTIIVLATTVISFVALAVAILTARLERPIRQGMEMLRIAVSVLGIVIVGSITGVATPIGLAIVAGVIGLAVGWAQGNETEVWERDGRLWFRRGALGAALFIGGMIGMQLAGIGSRTGLFQFGQALAIFSVCTLIGVMAGRSSDRGVGGVMPPAAALVLLGATVLAVGVVGAGSAVAQGSGAWVLVDDGIAGPGTSTWDESQSSASGGAAAQEGCNAAMTGQFVTAWTWQAPPRVIEPDTPIPLRAQVTEASTNYMNGGCLISVQLLVSTEGSFGIERIGGQPDAGLRGSCNDDGCVWREQSSGFNEILLTAGSGRAGSVASFSWRLQQAGPQATYTWTYEWDPSGGAPAPTAVPAPTSAPVPTAAAVPAPTSVPATPATPVPTSSIPGDPGSTRGGGDDPVAPIDPDITDDEAVASAVAVALILLVLSGIELNDALVVVGRTNDLRGLIRILTATGGGVANPSATGAASGSGAGAGSGGTAGSGAGSGGSGAGAGSGGAGAGSGGSVPAGGLGSGELGGLFGGGGTAGGSGGSGGGSAGTGAGAGGAGAGSGGSGAGAGSGGAGAGSAGAGAGSGGSGAGAGSGGAGAGSAGAGAGAGSGGSVPAGGLGSGELGGLFGGGGAAGGSGGAGSGGSGAGAGSAGAGAGAGAGSGGANQTFTRDPWDAELVAENEHGGETVIRTNASGRQTEIFDADGTLIASEWEPAVASGSSEGGNDWYPGVHGRDEDGSGTIEPDEWWRRARGPDGVQDPNSKVPLFGQGQNPGGSGQGQNQGASGQNPGSSMTEPELSAPVRNVVEQLEGGREIGGSLYDVEVDQVGDVFIYRGDRFTQLTSDGRLELADVGLDPQSVKDHPYLENGYLDSADPDFFGRLSDLEAAAVDRVMEPKNEVVAGQRSDFVRAASSAFEESRLRPSHVTIDGQSYQVVTSVDGVRRLGDTIEYRTPAGDLREVTVENAILLRSREKHPWP